MEIKEFIEKFAEAIEVEEVEILNAETEFRELDEWSSLSIMMLIAMMDEEYEKQVGDKEIKACQTIQDLYGITLS
ncbi:phosphopantetheine-binding protein [Marinifilum flexuosum]|uniref:Phosphopantetheine binding protein n=1 Tax=Marinifilum flexuosum TaxID=1117708 RepID=A0A419XA11_9BACT|nr:phosphopantetheine-binding protein [Marinifilum flexuosum]RKE04593.1 phosphopantetheine binding protein [Marinifilum flexuosum]